MFRFRSSGRYWRGLVSERIADCQVPIADYRLTGNFGVPLAHQLAFGNWQLAFGNPSVAFPCKSGKNLDHIIL